MSATPSWVSADPQHQVSLGNNDVTSNDVPSWLSPDITGHDTKGEIQLTAVQDDSVFDPTAVSTGSTGNTNTSTTTSTMTGTRTSSSPSSNMQAAREKTWGQFWRSSFQRDGRTILITILVVVLMNVPYVKWALYPFTIFSTWIHELCHGLAGLMVGASIQKLEIFPDTSGLATLTFQTTERFGFVASAGYQGTAVIGMLLLMMRRTKRGPRSGTMAVALMMFLSVALWIRNAFGIAFILGLGVLFFAAAFWMSSWWIRNFYVLVAVTCTLNAITGVRALFGETHQVNGQDVMTDAHAMAEQQGGSHTMWAVIWLFLGLGLAFSGMVFAIPGPDQSADFTLCGLCQDIGCFYICNAEGKRLWTTLFGGNPKKEEEDDTPTETKNGSNNV